MLNNKLKVKSSCCDHKENDSCCGNQKESSCCQETEKSCGCDHKENESCCDNQKESSCCQETEKSCGCDHKENKSSCTDNSRLSSLNEDCIIHVQFLFLDNEVCQRCMGTEEALYDAVDEVKSLIKNAGYILSIERIHIDSLAKAIQYEFVSSPTIRINGQDITMNIQETKCKDCGDLCGCDVDCRVWSYNGKRYDTLPKQLAIDAILRFIYGHKVTKDKAKTYVVPKNLARYFASLDKIKQDKHK